MRLNVQYRGLGLLLATAAWAAGAGGCLPGTASAAGGPAAGGVGKTAARGELRLASRQEVFTAIRDGLAKRGIPPSTALRPEDLSVQAAVPALRDDLGLEITRIGYDAIRGKTVFDLWSRNEPQYLPFRVTTSRAPGSGGLTVVAPISRPRRASANGVLGGEPLLPPSRPSALARPGHPATLIMLGRNLRITATVVPLQPGSKGDCILVRDLATARILHAEVVGDGLLEAEVP